MFISGSWKTRSGLSRFVLIELCSLGVAAEALRAKIVENRRFESQWVSMCQIITQNGTFTNHRPMNALQLCRWQFSHKETL